MPDWLLDRSTVIGLAIAGGALTILASWCQSKDRVSPLTIKRLNQAAYGCMAVSIVLFIGAGFFGPGK